MAVSMLDNFDIRKSAPNVKRDMFDTISDMKAYNENYLPQVFVSTCVEDGCIYIFNKGNDVDDVTGKWRKFEGGTADLMNYYNKTETNTLLDDKVDKETGKGLSTNDYTNEEKTKVQDTVDAVDVLNGAVTVEGSVEYKIQEAIGAMDTKINMVVTELPDIADARDDVIYLILQTGETDVYDLYMVVENNLGVKQYLKTGSTQIDLSGYALQEDIDDALAEKLDIDNGLTNANKAIVTDSSGNIIFVDKSTLGGDAENVTYTNTDFPALTDVDKALDSILAKLYYIEPEISTFTSVPATTQYENGYTITGGVVFNWTYNKDMTNQTLTDCTLADETVRTATYANDISANKTFTLTCGDGEKTATRAISFQFMNKVYWGVSADQDNYTDAWILGLSGSKLATNAKGSYNFTAGTGQYCYFALPTSMSISVKVNGFDTDLDTVVASRSFTNASGYTTTYKILRLHQPSLGTLTAVVS
ncbi:hypothetical protein [Pseudobutyrivibrio sp.]|uniref:hypothetical protein n=1 Tax=Pseudobutyrivibrio sp. TaxID=2014367 RepID=UPI0038635B57